MKAVADSRITKKASIRADAKLKFVSLSKHEKQLRRDDHHNSRKNFLAHNGS